MTPRQQDVFDTILQIGVPRPHAPAGVVDRVRDGLTDALVPTLRRWDGSSLWVSKSMLTTVLRCEAGFLADRLAGPAAGKHPSAAAGDLAHRAIQLAYTHPGQPVSSYVSAAAVACRRDDPAFATLWDACDIARQSDLLMTATSRVTALLDSWPALQASWEPRFEEPIQAKVAGVTLSARVDLVLGRPRPSGQQSMLVVDWKSGALREHHEFEASFHALVTTLSYGVPPFRSVVYSLTSGEHIGPQIEESLLMSAVDTTARAVTAMVDLLTSRRSPATTCGLAWCSACAGGVPAAA